MKKPSHLLSYPVVWMVTLLSFLPMRVLHGLASLLAFLAADVVRYRKKVVLTNLHNAFPGKNDREIRRIARDFYRHLADVVAETIKLLNISDSEMMRRCSMDDESKEMLMQYYNNGRSLIGLLGHFGNWEWVPPVTSINFPYFVVPAYRPLKNKVIDRLILKIRGRYAHELVPKRILGRTMIRYKRSEKPFILGLIADQTPRPQNAFQTTFLSQPTLVFNGPEKLARSMDMSVFFVALRRKKRGYYFFYVEKMTDNPGDMKEGELSRQFMRLLEKEILRKPSDWLWSHRRWKHQTVAADSDQ